MKPLPALLAPLSIGAVILFIALGAAADKHLFNVALAAYGRVRPRAIVGSDSHYIANSRLDQLAPDGRLRSNARLEPVVILKALLSQ